MRISLEFDTDGAAFDDPDGAPDATEIRRVFAAAAETAVALSWRESTFSMPIRDINGNTIGRVRGECP